VNFDYDDVIRERQIGNCDGSVVDGLKYHSEVELCIVFINYIVVFGGDHVDGTARVCGV
jgi:hypothetical protein